MIKTGEPNNREPNNRGCYGNGNTCCTILFLVVWAFYWYMVARQPIKNLQTFHFTVN